MLDPKLLVLVGFLGGFVVATQVAMLSSTNNRRGWMQSALLDSPRIETTRRTPDCDLLPPTANGAAKTPAVDVCLGRGEAYAAAYLSGREPLLSSHYGISTRQFMETGAVITNLQINPLRTVDMFDFGVEHLSWIDRQLGMKQMSGHVKEVAMNELVGSLERRTERFATTPVKWDPRVREGMVVIMPFFSGGDGDVGNSVPEVRRVYLNATFWSFRRHVRDIAICVCTENDASFLRTTGLPWYEIIQENCYINGTDPGGTQGVPIFKPDLMGVLTSRAAQKRLVKGEAWENKTWVFYTESDQLLHVRDLPRLLPLLSSDVWLSPHRMLPVPHRRHFPETVKALGNRSFVRVIDSLDIVEAPVEGHASCCFDRKGCPKIQDRQRWKYLANGKEEGFKLVMNGGEDSFLILGAAGNFREMHFRLCAAHSAMVDCPYFAHVLT